MSSMSHNPGDGRPEGVAIIAMTGRFPGARDLDQFWRNLAAGTESIAQLTDHDLLQARVSTAESGNPGFVRAASALDDVELFDAAFFGFSPREAEVMDPQQRIFLECAWEVLEAAGCDPRTFPGRIGMYAGARISDYLLYHVASRPEMAATVGWLQTLIGNDKDYLATLASYKLDLRGPSISVQTACSTSLVAVHLACEALLNAECDLALAGGISIRLPQKGGYVHTQGGIVSPDGHCRAFDARAAGTVFGNGVGLVALKRLEDALADGDCIRAVIRGSAINNDGAQKVGFTAPSVAGQAAVISEALELSGVDPESIGYVEAHGTGTPMGDPIEVEALSRAFRRRTRKQGFCVLGSVKTNIGHLESAAGVAGLIKSVLALENDLIPPSLHFEQPNPQIDFTQSPFHVSAQPVPWPAGGQPRRAGVSSFGIGGTNAHVVLEEAPAVPPSGPSRSWQILPLSARTPSELKRAMANLRDHLAQPSAPDLSDVAFTLRVGRRSFQHRSVAVVRDLGDARSALAEGSGRWLTGSSPAEDRPVVFLFPGQGSQYVDMAGDLYREEPGFRKEIDRCCDLLRPHLGLDLREVLFASAENAARAAERLNRTELTQPALFVVEYALARLWMEWGVKPWALLGHSIGEYVAACLSGVFSLQDALALVAVRGRLSQSAPTGSMLGVALGEEELRPLLGQRLAIAALNAPSFTVVSGPVDAVEALRLQLVSQSVDCRLLHTSHAFHSELMEGVLGPFEQHLRDVSLKPPQVPFISNLTGTWISGAEATDPVYWVRHLRRPVRFADGMAELLRQKDVLFLEVGPGRVLTTLVQSNAVEGGRPLAIQCLPHPDEEGSDVAALLTAAGRLWLAGIEIDPGTFYARERRRRVTLPTYPFERQRYWIERRARRAGSEDTSTGQEERGKRRPDLADWFSLPFWKPALPPAPCSLEAGGRWLLFVDGEGLGQHLAMRLRQEGQEVATVTSGSRFHRFGESSWTVDPSSPVSYRNLLAALQGGGQPLTRVVHLWGFGERPAELTEEGSAARAADLGFFSLLFLAQALGEAASEAPVRLLVVTSQLHQIGEEVCFPEKATVLGPCRVIPQEYSHLTCRSVDLSYGHARGRGLDDLAAILLAEVESETAEPVVAYRGGRRWIEAFEPAHLAAATVDRTRLRPRGVYLITGGVGGIGLELAEHLVRSVRARLVLSGLSPLPPRSAWSARIAELSPEDPLREKLERLEALEADGAEIVVASGDVADPAHIRDLLERARDRFGTVHGVFHLAGVPGQGIVQRKSREQAAAVLRPKVQGTLALAQGLAGLDLDFLVLASSTIALTGGPGQADYAGANAFLDAFAAEHALRTGIPTVAVAWSGWAALGMRRHSGGRLLPLRADAMADDGSARTFADELEPARHWVLSEHRVLGRPVLPGTALLELALTAFLQVAGKGPAELSDVVFLAPADVADDGRLLVQTVLEADENGFRFRIRSRSAGTAPTEWREHATGRVGRSATSPRSPENLQEILGRCREVPVEREVSRNGVVTWGPRWQSLRAVHLGEGEALARLELPADLALEAQERELHPALLDVATSFALPWIGNGHFLPFSYQRLRSMGPLPAKLYSHVRFAKSAVTQREVVTFDVILLDESGAVVAEIEQLTLRRLSPEHLRSSSSGWPTVEAGAGQGISAREGIEALDRILATGLPPRIVVSPRDIEVLREQMAQQLATSPAGETLGVESSHGRPDIATPYMAPRNQIEQAIAEIWQQALGIERVGVHDSFFELGGQSLLALRLVSELREAFGMDLPVAQIFNTPTIATLAAAILEKLTGGLEDELLDQAVSELEQLSELDAQSLLGDSTLMAERRVDV